jgi:hypothetical protein
LAAAKPPEIARKRPRTIQGISQHPPRHKNAPQPALRLGNGIRGLREYLAADSADCPPAPSGNSAGFAASPPGNSAGFAAPTAPHPPENRRQLSTRRALRPPGKLPEAPARPVPSEIASEIAPKYPPLTPPLPFWNAWNAAWNGVKPPSVPAYPIHSIYTYIPLERMERIYIYKLYTYRL